MMKALQVKDWNKVYENAKSRTIERLRWCPIPNKQHGLGYNRLMKLKDGPAIYGAFVAMILALSRHSVRDGWITEDGTEGGTPYTPDDLQLITGFPAKTMQAMLVACSDYKIGWIVGADDGQTLFDTVEPAKANGKGRKGPDIGKYAETLYGLYPRKQAKQKAIAAIQRAVTPMDDAQRTRVRQAIETFAAAVGKWPKDDRRYVPMCATWINQGRWEDDPETWKRHDASPEGKQVKTIKAKNDARKAMLARVEKAKRIALHLPHDRRVELAEQVENELGMDARVELTNWMQENPTQPKEGGHE